MGIGVGAPPSVDSIGARVHLSAMSDNPDKKLRAGMDRVLETIKAEAKRRGLDVEGKSMEEIKKLLADKAESERRDPE